MLFTAFLVFCVVKYSIWVQGEWQTKMLSADEVENLLKEKFAEVISSKNKGVIMKIRSQAR